MHKVSILGATGYVGEELVRLLYRHPHVQLTQLASHSYSGKAYSEVYPHTYQAVDTVCSEDTHPISDADILFIALPHGIASKVVTKELLKKTKVIDLGADFRISKEAYQAWYQVPHYGEDLLQEAVYGLCEWEREKIRTAQLIANPGCYVTCSLLSLLPLVKAQVIDLKSIIIDGKSGVTGAGRNTRLDTHFTECNESIKAYGVTTHRHTPEIEEKLSAVGGDTIHVTFTPHLVPMNRGILTTIYATLKEGVTKETIAEVYDTYYKAEQFIRILGDTRIAETRFVKGSNYCDISFKVDERTGRIVLVSSIDNMMKGAASQAVQNMNIMMGWDESTGIDMLPIFPG